MANEKDAGGGRKPVKDPIDPSGIVIDAVTGNDPGAPAPGTYVPSDIVPSAPTDPAPPKTPPVVPSEPAPAATRPAGHGGTITGETMPEDISDLIPGAEQPVGQTTTARALAEVPSLEDQERATQGIYEQTMAALSEAGLNPPSYVGRYDDQINEIYNQITGRGNFSYDLDADALYQQYRDQYVNQGRMAMRDSMGQASALTGGYGSTYGQAVGQQQYDRYLQELNDLVPELYDRAYKQYQDQGDRMLREYQMLLDKDSTDYNRYMDDYNKFLTERSYADSLEEREYQRQQDALNKLNGLIQIGYSATDEEIQAAGLTRAQYNAMKKYYDSLRAAQQAAAAGGGDDGYETWDFPEARGARRSDIMEMQKQLGVKVDGVWGPASHEAYEKKYGKTE